PGYSTLSLHDALPIWWGNLWWVPWRKILGQDNGPLLPCCFCLAFGVSTVFSKNNQICHRGRCYVLHITPPSILMPQSPPAPPPRSEEHTSELQSRENL